MPSSPAFAFAFADCACPICQGGFHPACRYGGGYAAGGAQAETGRRQETGPLWSNAPQA
ncbi:hypothetical protein [Streptomyces sp. NBC_01477]|uniref:hypothetical protein n=1 Tax=Streptomyces sp. NBC_01477 TaxID=2976015 RepID=UPI002E307676|nr:hypothetical protein [Streptomyces sp. NBC_01477]